METQSSPNLRRLPTWRDLILVVVGAFLVWGVLRTEARITEIRQRVDEIRQRVDAVAAQVAEVKDDVDDAADDLDDADQALDEIKDDIKELGYVVLSGRQR
jgi:peptidoglycan hydrolase CwlO-like protein